MATFISRLKGFVMAKVQQIRATSLEDFFSQIEKIASGVIGIGEPQEDESREPQVPFAQYSQREFISKNISTNEKCEHTGKLCLNTTALMDHVEPEAAYYISHYINMEIGQKVEALVEMTPEKRHEVVTDIIHEQIQRFYH